MKPELSELYHAKAKFESLINQGLDLQEHLRRPEVMPLTPPRQSIADVLNYRLMNALFRDYFALNRQILAESPELAHSLRIKTIDVSTILILPGKGTSLEQVAETLLGPDPRSVLVHLYWTQKLGFQTIAEMTGITIPTLAKIIRQYHITTRTQATGVLLINQNPVKRAIMSTKRHTVDSGQKRSQSIRQFFASHPEVVENIHQRSKQTNQLKFEAKIRQIFGDDPVAELNRLLYQDQLTPKQIISIVNARLSSTAPKLTMNVLDYILQKLDIRKNSTLRAVPKDHFELVSRALYQDLLSQLSQREQTILIARYLTHPPKTLIKLAEELSLTRERIRQMESKAIKKLEDYLSGKATVLKAAPGTRGRPRKNPLPTN